MSDSIAITTIRALSSRSSYGGLPRPPAENRIKLYGLYKQATEGDVAYVMPRPIGFTPEDEGARRKWDAWKREEGKSRTESKREYISYLIDTMRSYASGTHEARELLSELEYLWDQIKDLQVGPDDVESHHHIIPPHSPLIQLDRYSNATPLPPGSTYLGAGGYLQQYKTNLQKIYSHSRRSTMLSLSEYQQQNPHVSQIVNPTQLQFGGSQSGTPFNLGPRPGSVAGGALRALSTYSLPPRARQLNGPATSGAAGAATATAAAATATGATVTGATTVAGLGSGLDDIRAWQSEINLVINKLSKEFLTSRHKKYSRIGGTDLEESLEYTLDEREQLKRRILAILKFIGYKGLMFLKNIFISSLTLMFVVWCIKRNVIVQQTMVKNSQKQKELVINMVVNVNENRWFIRMLNFVNSFIGFV